MGAKNRPPRPPRARLRDGLVSGRSFFRARDGPARGLGNPGGSIRRRAACRASMRGTRCRRVLYCPADLRTARAALPRPAESAIFRPAALGGRPERGGSPRRRDPDRAPPAALGGRPERGGSPRRRDPDRAPPAALGGRPERGGSPRRRDPDRAPPAALGGRPERGGSPRRRDPDRAPPAALGGRRDPDRAPPAALGGRPERGGSPRRRDPDRAPPAALGGRPERGRSSSPSIPRSRKRACHALIVLYARCRAAATCVRLSPQITMLRTASNLSFLRGFFSALQARRSSACVVMLHRGGATPVMYVSGRAAPRAAGAGRPGRAAGRVPREEGGLALSGAGCPRPAGRHRTGGAAARDLARQGEPIPDQGRGPAPPAAPPGGGRCG